MKYFTFALIILTISGLVTIMFSSNSKAATGSAHQFTFLDIEGNPMMMEDFKDSVKLVVNTASQCGFTGQYEALQKIHDQYKDQGFTVIGIPSNDFGGQEPGSEEDIQTFTSSKYNVTFPMTQKYNVKGTEAHPFYAWAASQGKGGLIFSKPRWNFHKYLIGPDGSLIGSFGSQVSPDSQKITSVIEENLVSKSE